MGFWQTVLSRLTPVRHFSPNVVYLNNWGRQIDIAGMSVAKLWATQAHLRTVVTFRARNVAQLGLHVFARESDTDRRRDHESPLAKALRRPDSRTSEYDLIFSLIGDLDLYDRAYWWLVPDHTADGWVWRLRRVPPPWVHTEMKNPWEVDHYLFYVEGQEFKVSPEHVMEFSGYSPESPDGCSPTISSLKATLQEQIEAASYREQTWKRGGRVSGIISRPKDAPWSTESAERFKEDWAANYTGRGPQAGGTPVLEDGMTFQKLDFSARDQQYIEAQELTLATVAAAFHVNPTMVGLTKGTNYSNVREFRRALYQDTLGPVLSQVQDAINAFLLPRLGMDPSVYYAEFNLQAKLAGSFEEQAMVMQTMVGAPIMTRNEGRARFNLPRIDDSGDELITPLNVTEGGQASPTDSGSQNWTGANAGQLPAAKSAADPLAEGVSFKAQQRDEEAEADLTKTLQAFFARQKQVVKTRLGAKSPDWWDEDRWDEELEDSMLEDLRPLVVARAREALKRAGIDPEKFNAKRTAAFERAVAARIARQMNEATLQALVEAMEEAAAQEAADAVFEEAAEVRAPNAAVTAVTTFAGFAVVEAFRQTRPRAYKRWIVTSSNPRASHASMHGEEQPLDEDFSNGLPWPGSYSSDVDEIAGCQCEITIFTKE